MSLLFLQLLLAMYQEQVPSYKHLA